MKVVYADYVFKDKNIERERYGREGIEVVFSETLEAEALKQICRDADAVVTSYGDLNRDFIESLTQCKVLVRTGMGVNNIDVEAATEKGIIVAIVRDYCEDEVSDQALTFIMALMRKTFYLNQIIRQKKRWSMNDARPIPRLSDTVVNLLGFGAIAKTLARKLKAVGFQVAAYDPFVADEHFEKLGVQRIAEFDDLFPTADVLSIHLPLSAKTRDMVRLTHLQRMKPSAYLVNVARGGIVNERDLYEAVRDGVIAGAGLDVLEDEHPDLDQEPLVTLDEVIFSPHIGYYSEGSELALQQGTIDQCILGLTTGQPKYFVNKEELAAR